MSDLKLVNFFNALYISNCRVIYFNGRPKVIIRDTVTALAVPIVLGLINAFCGVAVFQLRQPALISNVAYISTVFRLCAIILIVPILGVVFLLDRRKICNLLQRIITFDEQFKKATNNWQSFVKIRLVRAQITIIFLVYGLVIGIRVIISVIYFEHYGFITVALLCSTLCLEMHFCLQQIFVQFFAEHLTLRYRLLEKALNSCNRLKALLKLYDQLFSIQQLLANTFGIQCLLATLLPFVNCAVVSFGILYIFTTKIALIHIFMEPVYLFPSVALFFGFTYQFERLTRAEQEFKNAIKSLQYEATEEHSEDYLNFLDLINLKLMTESPKITACGLFTVNLQVFYNVFAAIVTYIMILFQFRDFEK